jgi:hypothetical protein
MRRVNFSIGQQTAGSRRPGTGGKIGLTLFFSVFLAMGLLFCGVLGFAFWKSLGQYQWKMTGATIVSSEVREDGGGNSPYRVEVRYEYTWEGKRHASSVFADPATSHSRYSAAQEEIAALPAGALTVCYVNPERAEEAVLQRGNLWIGAFVFIPLVFVMVGGGGIAWIWFSPQARTGAVSESGAPSIARNGQRLPVILGGVFTIIGACIFFFWFLPTWQKAQASKHWTATPCTVLSSKVRSHSSDDGTTYSIDILYRYTVARKEYKSDRYDIFGGSSSGYDGKAEVVARHPEGAEAICYVNPENPSEAVLKTGAGWMTLLGLIPAAFLGGGLLVIGASRKSGKGTGHPAIGNPAMADPAAGPMENVLKPSATPAVKFGACLFFALFWNGIVSVFVWQIVKSFQRGNPDWFQTLFMIPFVLVGIGALVMSGYFALALANPRCRLRLLSPRLQPGGTLEVEWSFSGSVRRLQRLHLYLEGREESRYRRGTSTYTDRETFARLPVAEASAWAEMAQGTGKCWIPYDAMPSFSAPNNKIIWALKIRGEIERWPDVEEDYELVIWPAGEEGA